VINYSSDVSLKDFTTMKLGGRAKFMVNLKSLSQLDQIIEWVNKESINFLMIGGGSNIIWLDEGFNGLLIVNQLPGFEVENHQNDWIIKVGAGEIWDKIVAKTVLLGLSGIEALSLIPGKVGGTVMQNVGAYGQEIKDSLIDVEVFDTVAKKYQVLSRDQCLLDYRSSLFKNYQPRQYLILSLRLRLTKNNFKYHSYEALDRYFDDHKIVPLDSETIRQAVMNIRRTKLPNPAEIANCGSFFANPIVTQEQFDKLNLDIKHKAPHWTFDHKIKLSAAWLIEYSGLKDFHDRQTGFATWFKQPLIVINENGKTTKDLIKFKDLIVNQVFQKTQVRLSMEPEFLPN